MRHERGEPGNADAHNNLAWLYYTKKENLDQAETLALKALELDNTIAQAHEVLALILFQEFDWAGDGPEFERAIALNPNYPDTRAFYSHYLMIMGRRDEAMTTIERALQLDPFNIQVRACYIVDLLYARRSDDVLAEARNAGEDNALVDLAQ